MGGTLYTSLRLFLIKHDNEYLKSVRKIKPVNPHVSSGEALPPSCVKSLAFRIEDKRFGAWVYSELEQVSLTQKKGILSLWYSGVWLACLFKLTKKLEALHKFAGDEPKSHSFCTNYYIFFPPEPLPSPTLNCTSTGENITVSCEIPEDYESHQAPIRYSWSCPLAQCNNSPEPTMSFQKKDGFLQKILCTVSNPLVNKTSSIYLETCVPGGE